jgi:hypothetical protein
MANIKVETAGEYAHKATFEDAFGNIRTVYTLNGRNAALQAAKNRINETRIYGRNTIKIKNFRSFISKLFKRRKINKLAAISRKKNR